MSRSLYPTPRLEMVSIVSSALGLWFCPSGSWRLLASLSARAGLSMEMLGPEAVFCTSLANGSLSLAMLRYN